MNRILIRGFRDKLKQAADQCKQCKDVPEGICEFAKQLAKNAPDEVGPEELEYLLEESLVDLKEGKYGYSPAERSNLVANYKWFPKIIDCIGNELFSKEFRKCFEIFGQATI